MKIAVVCSQYPVASETFIRAQVAMLMQRGHEVHVFADLVGGYVPAPNPLDASIAARTHYTRWPAHGGILSQVAKAMLVVTARAFRTPRLLGPAIRHAGRLLDPDKRAHYFKALEFWAQGDFDVILSHFGHVGLQVAQMSSAGLISSRFATVLHGEDVSRYLLDHGQNAYEVLFRHCDVMLPVSSHWARVIQAAGCEPSKIIVQHMGIDTQRIPFRPRHVHGADKVRFLSVCRLVEKKGLEYALKAIARIASEFREKAQYTIIGDGPLRKDLESLARDLGISDCVEFLGWKSHDEVLGIVNAAHVSVAPSVTAANGDMEGIPVSIMEAMAAGLPVISTFHSGIPELVEDGVSGLLVPERDDAALAGAMARLIREPDDGIRISQAARVRVEAQFDNRTLGDELEECLRTAAVSSDPARP